RRVPDEPDALGVVRGFSRTATVTLLLVVLGGSASALLLTNGLDSGITTYVWIVLAKLAVVGAHPRGTPRHPCRTRPPRGGITALRDVRGRHRHDGRGRPGHPGQQHA